MKVIDTINKTELDLTVDEIIDLVANHVNGIHVYSMNKPDVAARIRENLSEILGPQR